MTREMIITELQNRGYNAVAQTNIKMELLLRVSHLETNQILLQLSTRTTF